MQKLVRVNAKYRISGDPNNFVIKFDVRDLDNVKGIAVARACLNRAFPNIYSPINILSYQPNLGSQINLTIPPAQYTATTLAAAIQLASGGDWSVTYSAAPIDRFIFTYNNVVSGSAQLLSSSSIAPYIGLTSDVLVPAVATPTTLPSPPSLQGPECVYIQSNFIAGSHCVDIPSNGSYIPFLCCIDFTNVPYGFSAYFEAKTPQIFQITYARESGTRLLQLFDVQVTDKFGNLLDLPENDNLDMHMVFYY